MGAMVTIGTVVDARVDGNEMAVVAKIKLDVGTCIAEVNRFSLMRDGEFDVREIECVVVKSSATWIYTRDALEIIARDVVGKPFTVPAYG